MQLLPSSGYWGLCDSTLPRYLLSEWREWRYAHTFIHGRADGDDATTRAHVSVWVTRIAPKPAAKVVVSGYEDETVACAHTCHRGGWDSATAHICIYHWSDGDRATPRVCDRRLRCRDSAMVAVGMTGMAQWPVTTVIIGGRETTSALLLLLFRAKRLWVCYLQRQSLCLSWRNSSNISVLVLLPAVLS